MERTDSASSPLEEEQALRREQIQAAERLVKEYPTNDDAVYLLGLVHHEQGDTVSALQFWERSLELDPSRADANDSVGHALLLRDEYEKAEAYFRRALALEASLPTANFRLATTLVHESKFQEAVSILEKAQSLSAEGQRLLGEAYQNLKQYERAKASYEAALKLKPELAEAHYGLSRVLAQLGEQDQSTAQFEIFAELKKENDHQARQARARYDTVAITRMSVAQTHTDVGRVYLRQGRPDEAESLWLRAANLDSSNTLCRLQLAVLNQQKKKDREALRFYEEVARLDPADGLVQLNLGRVSLKLKDWERAERAFREVIRLEPNRPEGPSALAQLYLQTNRNLAEARRWAQIAVALAPEARHFAVLSRTCAANDDPFGALAAIDKAIELQPTNEQYRYARDLLSGKR